MRLSVGTRWTLRYSLAMLLTVVILAILVYDRVDRRIQQDAELLLDLQAAEAVEALARLEGDYAGFDRWLDEKLRAGGPFTGLGVALYDREGSLRLASGALERRPLPVTRDFLAAVDEEGFYEADLGRSYPHFVTARPVEAGLLQVAIYSRPFAKRAGHIGRVFVIAVPVTVVLTFGLGWWLTRHSLAPIAEITETARRITGAHLEDWIPTSGTGDELDRLVETLNGMMARIREGLERSREFQTRLARELRAPLLGLQREIAALAEEEGLSDYGKRRMHRALEDAEVLADAVHALLRLAWSDAGRAPTTSIDVPLASLVRGAAANVALSAERREVALSLGPLVETSVAGDPFWLHQLFDAVLEAAVASAPRGGDVAVWAEKLEDPATCVVTLRARPAPPESISRGVAEKPEPLGAAVSARLSLAREVARAHGGELRSEPREPGEVEHQLRLPA